MAIKSNSSEQEVATGGKKLYTGITSMSVVAVNPTLEELHAMDIMYQSEPNYTVDFGKGEEDKVNSRIENLTSQIENAESDFEKEQLRHYCV